MKTYISWDEFDNLVDELADMIPEGVYEGVYAVPRGGLITGVMLSHKLDLPFIDRLQSYYGKKFHKKLTANGETFNMYKVSAAHKSYPLGTKVRVTNLENGKSIIDFSRHEIVICLILVTVILIIGVFPTLIQDLLGNSYERLLLK